MRKNLFCSALALACAGAGLTLGVSPAMAQAHHQGGGRQMAAPEMERAPMAYPRFERPQGTQTRPSQLDRPYYNHNFNADRTYHIGPYHPPRGFQYRRWAYGDILPGIFWGQDYWLTDYWLFGLDVPPVGYEWVRYGPDALLVNITTGEVVQVVYGRFF
ncbi:MAG: hypothetical protein BGP17_06435 [Sphingomonas sp. 67-41]|nr:MAG: hypothetical protein BGP17_06435 [Sphingomonas sp. 67-41]